MTKGARALTGSKTGSLLLRVAIGMAVVVLVGIGIRTSVSGSPSSRALTVAQMDAIFGDGTNPCKKNYTCKTAFKSGTSNCGYCDGSNSRNVCCNLGNETTCGYSDQGSQCGTGVAFMVGAVYGSYVTCDTCTSSKLPSRWKL